MESEEPWSRRTAFLYEKLPGHRVRCVCCNQRCNIGPGETGVCGVRQNKEGELHLLVYNNICSVHTDPIEKKPLYHFLPGSMIISAGTVGCNFSCEFCQNWQMSQVTKDIKARLDAGGVPELIDREVGALGYNVSPQKLVRMAISGGAPSIAFTYNEPTIFAEYAYDTSVFAKKHKIKSVFVTNGYESPETMQVVGPWLDGMNIDIKSFRNSFYQKLSRVRLAPVLQTVKTAYEMGIHLELTTLIIPGENDSDQELRDIATFIYGLSPSIPWHVSAFHPDFRMIDKPRTPTPTLERAVKIGKEAGLHYVFAGNVQTDKWSDSRCPRCNELLVQRRGRRVRIENVSVEESTSKGFCGQCKFPLYGVWSREPHRPIPDEDTEVVYGFPKPWSEDLAEVSTSYKRKRVTIEFSDDRPSLHILFATQTGTAEEFAKEMAEEGKNRGYSAVAQDLEEYDMEALPREKLVVFVASTHGEGEPPDNALEFARWLDHDHSDGLLQGVKFAVFGLGRRQYGKNYCAFARRLDTRMAALGAERIFRLGQGDDSITGQQEADWMEWKDTLWNTLAAQYHVEVDDGGRSEAEMRKAHFRFSQCGKRDEVAAVPDPHTAGTSIKKPLEATILANEELHSSESERSARRITISIKGSNLKYEAGDHLGVFPQNPGPVVRRLAARMDISPSVVFTLAPAEPNVGPISRFQEPISVQTALARHCDVMAPVSRRLLRVLADYAEKPSEKSELLELCRSTPEGRAKYQEVILNERLNLLGVLEAWPSVHPPIEHVLELLPKLAPRYYSISSSSKAHADQIDLTVAVVKFETPKGKVIKGLCSHYLARLRQGDSVSIYLRPSSFHLPTDPSRPIVMAAGGCGVAPLRGFIQERAWLLNCAMDDASEGHSAIGPATLYFGCRDRRKDYIYEEELVKAREGGVLSEIYLAFSREREDKVYIQHLMEETADVLWQTLTQGDAVFYVCGNALSLGADVRRMILKIAHKQGGLTEEQAQEWLEDKIASGAWLEDLYSLTA